MRLPSYVYKQLGFTHEQFEEAMLLVQQLGSNQAADQAMALAPGTVAKWAKEWIKAQRELALQADKDDPEALDIEVNAVNDHAENRASRAHTRVSRRAAFAGKDRSDANADEADFEEAEAALQAFRRGAEFRSARGVHSQVHIQSDLQREDSEAPQQRQLALARLEEVAEGLRKLSEVSERAALTQSKASADDEIKAMLKLATTMMEFMRKQQDSNQEQLQSVQGRLKRIEEFQQQNASRTDPSIAVITQLEELARSLDELSTEEQIIQIQDDVADLRDLIDETLRLAPRLQEIARELFRSELHDHSRLLGEQLATLLRQHADAMIESDARMPGAIADLLMSDWDPSFAGLREAIEHSLRQQASSFSNLRNELDKKDQELRHSIERRDQSLRSWLEQQAHSRNQYSQQLQREQQGQLREIVGGITSVSGQVDGLRRLVDDYGSVSAHAEQIHRLHQEIARLQRVVEQLQEKSSLRIML